MSDDTNGRGHVRPGRLLDQALYDRIEELCTEADALVEAGEHDRAITVFLEALRVLPKPVEDWEAATLLHVSIGDAYFRQGAYEPARRAFAQALRSPCPAEGVAFLHLVLGKACFELGELDQAADALARAYELEGPEVFEDEPPRYLELLRTRGRVAPEDEAT